MSNLPKSTLVETMPIMPLREVVMFPRSIVPLFVGRDASVKAVDAAVEQFDRQIFLVAQKDSEKSTPLNDDLCTVGTVSRILQVLRLPDGTTKVLFEGLYRASWHVDGEDSALEQTLPLVQVQALEEDRSPDEEEQATIKVAREIFDDYAKQTNRLTPEIIQSIGAVQEAGKLADAIAPHIKVNYLKKQTILEELQTAPRLEKLCALLVGETSINSLEKRIRTRVKEQMEQNQREYYLNEQIKAIHKELGREDDPQEELRELERQLADKKIPEQARTKASRELKKLRTMLPSSAEYTVLRTYVDWVLDLPWQEIKEASIDIDKARATLDNDHYGLEKPKERILEYLAVQKLVNKLKGPILCLVGPPGVGKTSLAKSIATATGREFVRLSLGGVRDEAEIRGHRRTYVGAMPGKIIQSLKRVKFNNPLFCLDEIDKMSTDFRGDPSAALLEVLDPEQNYSFNDHYLDLDYDLSQVFFITTANTLQSIPLPLRDRMEIITLPGYLETEKINIAKEFLLPKQIEAHGIRTDNMRISESCIMDIIRYYTKEAGVRSLERNLATVCRKVAMQIVDANSKNKMITVSKQNIGTFLGVKKHRYGEKEASSQIGVCTGLAFTELGGDILMVETAIMPGSGKVSTTGKLGEVMTESAQAALSYIRSRSDMFALRPDFHKDIDIHIHVPEGATPKDGPSAGITLATSLISALLGIPVRNDVAMTGEITLRGRVLPIGGLREKLLAARRGLIKTVIIPRENEKDLKEVPAEVLKGLTIVPVDHVDEVLPIAMQGKQAEIFPGTSVAAPLYLSLKNVVEAVTTPTH